MTRAHLIKVLRDYFTSKGRILTYQEYIAAEDTPCRIQFVKRQIGSWARLEKLIGEIEKPVAEVKPEIKPKLAVKPAVGAKK